MGFISFNLPKRERKEETLSLRGEGKRVKGNSQSDEVARFVPKKSPMNWATTIIRPPFGLSSGRMGKIKPRVSLVVFLCVFE
jgi:hypothetical protein